MNNRALSGIVLLILATVSLSTHAVSVEFSDPGFESFNNSFGAGNEYIWETGDYWRQELDTLSLTSVASANFHLTVQNSLDGPVPFSVDIFINSVLVGGFDFPVVDPDGTFVYDFGFSFPTIAGAGVGGTAYLVEFVGTNTIAGGDGSVRMTRGSGSSFVEFSATSVPEPSILGLLGVGLLGAGFASRSRKQAS